MRRDVKIGMTAGAVLAVILAVWVAARSGMSVEQRAAQQFAQNQKQQYAQQGSGEAEGVLDLDVTEEPWAKAPPLPVLSEPNTSTKTQIDQYNQDEPNELENEPDYNMPAQKPARYHIVRSGETLSKIAQDYLGSAARWREIYQANKELLKDSPDRVRVGMKLKIPEVNDNE